MSITSTSRLVRTAGTMTVVALLARPLRERRFGFDVAGSVDSGDPPSLPMEWQITPEAGRR